MRNQNETYWRKWPNKFFKGIRIRILLSFPVSTRAAYVNSLTISRALMLRMQTIAVEWSDRTSWNLGMIISKCTFWAKISILVILFCWWTSEVSIKKIYFQEDFFPQSNNLHHTRDDMCSTQCVGTTLLRQDHLKSPFFYANAGFH